MASTNFDRFIERRGSAAKKWHRFAPDVLPFWVADMDFAAPDFILDAIHTRTDHGILGYTYPPPALIQAFLGWLARHYEWAVHEDWLEWIPGVVPGLNLAAAAVAEAGSAIVMNTPVYYPFLAVPGNTGQTGIHAPLVREGNRWVIDFDLLDAAITPATRLLLACNPQNPTGRAYTRAELERLAEVALRHDLVICSDEIHAAILLDPAARHIPIATLSPEIAERTITLYAATKTYNIPGLGCAVAVIPNPRLRARFTAERRDLVPGVGPLAFAATTAAFADRSPWVGELCAYLRGNHEALRAVAGERMTPVEATYLAWIDISDLALGHPAAHFERHGLGLSIGEQFAGPGHIRFNFACPRATLTQGLERLARALAHPHAD